MPVEIFSSAEGGEGGGGWGFYIIEAFDMENGIHFHKELKSGYLNSAERDD